MVPERVSRVEVLGIAFRFLAILTVLVALAALAQIPAESPGTRRWPGPCNRRPSATPPTHPFSCR